MILDLKSGKRDAYVEYKKKKNISLEISPEGFITIRAPIGIGEEELQKAIEPLIPKIDKKLELIEKNKKIYEEGSYNNEEYFKLFGKYVSYEENNIPIENREKELSKFYTRELKKYLDESLLKWSKKMGLKYKEYKITKTKTTWGTCNSDKKLTFNLRLAMAPEDVIEYVVVHELAHIKHLNHDKGFWTTVGKYIPDYKQRQEYLKKFGQFMQV